jgi:Asp-tRNA(Asn)/Glu-tRNA(Gln) amidotransferase C subunit
LSRISFLNSDISLEQVADLAKLQSLSFSDQDMANIYQQFKLIASHAELVMAFTLDEVIEPAPEYRP